MPYQPRGGGASLPLATTSDPETVLNNASASTVLATNADGNLAINGIEFNVTGGHLVLVVGATTYYAALSLTPP